MRKLLIIFLIFIMCLNLSGCYDSKEISRLAFVMAIGFDEGSYSFQLVKPSAFEGDGGDDSPLLTLTVEAPDVYMAMEQLNSSISEKCDYSHIKMVIFSQEKLQQGIESEINAILKSNDFHPNTRIAMCEGKVSEYMADMEIPLDANPAEYYENIFKQGYTDYAPDVKLKDMQKNFKTHISGNVLPLLNSKKGMAVTRGYILTGIADTDETFIYNLLKNKNFEGNYSPINSVVLSLKKKSCSFTVDLSEKTPFVTVNLRLDGNIIHSSGDVNKDILKVQTTEKIASDITGFLYKTSTQYKADILELYRLAKMQYTTVAAWEKEDWQGLFEKANYNVNVSVEIKREGLYIN